MKILYINSTHFDYMQDILYSGLVKVLGTENVKSIPFNKLYCIQTKQYPKNLGFNKGNSCKYIISSIKSIDYDCVIVASAKKDTFEKYIEIAPHIPSHIPVVFVDGGDFSAVGGDLQRKNCFELFEKALSMREFDIVFKREMIIGEEYAKNVYPCPFAFNLNKVQGIKNDSKKYDVSFWAVESDEIRTKALGLIQDKFDCKENGTTLKQTFKQYKRKGRFYLEELQRCKIVLNFRGRGWDTLRYWEVPALKVCMISQKPQIIIPHEFTHEKNIIYCNDNVTDLIDLCDYYLKHETRREEIAQESYNHLVSYHTDIERAKYVLQIISNFKK